MPANASWVSAARVHRVEQRGEVAIAEEDLRVAPDQVEVEMRQEACAPPPAAHGQDRLDLRVGEERVDVRGPVLVAAGEVPVPVHQVRAALDREAHGHHRLGHDLHVLPQEGGAGRVDQADHVAGAEPRRLDRRRPRRGRRRGGPRAGRQQPGRANAQELTTARFSHLGSSRYNGRLPCR
jgi:hypothetical protein